MATRRSLTSAALRIPARPVVPIAPLARGAKLKLANLAAANLGVLQKFKDLVAPVTFGFNASNVSSSGTLVLGPGVLKVDFDARRVALQAGAGPAPNWPVTLNLMVETGHFYVIDVHAVPEGGAVFSAVSNRTSPGANYTTNYSITVDSTTQHALFVLQAHGKPDGTKNGYRIEIGADKPWSFEKIEVSRVE